MSEQIEKVIALEKKIVELEFRIKMDESLYNELANHHKVNRTLINNYRETLKAIKKDNLDKVIVAKIEELKAELNRSDATYTKADAQRIKDDFEKRG